MKAHDQKRRQDQEKPAQRRTSQSASGPLAQLETAANQGPGARQTLRMQRVLNGPGVVQGVFDKEKFLEALRAGEQKAALKHLEGATFEELGRSMIGVGNDKKVSQEALAYLYDKADSPVAKLGAWQALAYRRSNMDLDRALTEKLVPEGKENTIRGGIFEDVDSGGEYLKEEIEKIQNSTAWFKDSKSRQAVERFDQIFLQARKLELQQGVSIRASKSSMLREEGSEYQAFNSGELDILGSVLSRLPREHVVGNPYLEFFQRQPRHPALASRGAEYSRNERRVNVFDGTFGGPYRATGETSVLGEHEKNPLTPGEEALTHEIGHSVDALFPDVATAFAQAGGWEKFDDDEAVKGALLAKGAQDEEAETLVNDLNQDRAQETRPRKFHGGFEYMVNPDGAGFYRRQLNRMPGDPQTPESGDTHMDYARTSPKEHFAEMYAHMIHVPERTYQDYVRGPEQREMDARRQYDALAIAAQQDQGQEVARDVAYLKYEEARAQRIALESQWNIMREQVFGVTDDRVKQEIPNLKENAGKAGLDAEAAEKEFVARVQQVATPSQIVSLAKSIFYDMLAKKKR